MAQPAEKKASDTAATVACHFRNKESRPSVSSCEEEYELNVTITLSDLSYRRHAKTRSMKSSSQVVWKMTALYSMVDSRGLSDESPQ
jgi:hypothetical protein